METRRVCGAMRAATVTPATSSMCIQAARSATSRLRAGVIGDGADASGSELGLRVGRDHHPRPLPELEPLGVVVAALRSGYHGPGSRVDRDSRGHQSLSASRDSRESKSRVHLRFATRRARATRGHLGIVAVAPPASISCHCSAGDWRWPADSVDISLSPLGASSSSSAVCLGCHEVNPHSAGGHFGRYRRSRRGRLRALSRGVGLAGYGYCGGAGTTSAPGGWSSGRSTRHALRCRRQLGVFQMPREHQLARSR